jgi:hypothetical protein
MTIHSSVCAAKRINRQRGGEASLDTRLPQDYHSSFAGEVRRVKLLFASEQSYHVTEEIWGVFAVLPVIESAVGNLLQSEICY